MLLRKIQIVLVVVFILIAISFCAVVAYEYTHNDIAPPVITSDAELIEVSVKASDKELCAGLRAFDNIDGEITDQIQVMSVSQLINATDAKIKYLVFDSSSNSVIYERTVRYTDYRRPHFKLSKPLVYTLGSTVTLLDRLGAEDVLDGNISNRLLLIQSTVTNVIAGNYSILVQVTNSAGDTAILPLTVTIRSESVTTPTIYLREYLRYVHAGEKIDYASLVSKITDPAAEGVVTRSSVTVNTEKVDLSTPGTYEAFYMYEGKSGELTTTILTIVVE